MQAGKHRTRITIERPTETAAADGQLVPSWSTYASRWASVRHTVSVESFTDKQSKAVLSA